MNMREAMAETVRMAVERGRCFCLYVNTHGEYQVSELVWNDWLFKAYPGGRKQLSIKGSELLAKEEEE